MIAIPANIELIYHGSYVEFVKDGDPNKPLSPDEKHACDAMVALISKMADRKRRQDGKV